MTKNNSELDELRVLYTKIRAGKDPDTKQLHITENEFVQAILSTHISKADLLEALQEEESNKMFSVNTPESQMPMAIIKRNEVRQKIKSKLGLQE